MARQKLCLISFGGSVSKHFNHAKNRFEDSDIVYNLFSFIPELQSRFDLEVIQIYNGNSFDIGPQEMQELCEAIYERYDDYTGFVVLHGTSTMSYTASYVSFVFQNLDKPIVFTGSILPLGELGSEARNNIINSCIVATLDYAEVLIVYGASILRANRAKKAVEQYTEVFRSPNFPKLGEIRRPIRIGEERKKRRRRNLQYQPYIDNDIATIRAHLGMDGRLIELAAVDLGQAVIIQGFGAGVIPSSIVPTIEKLLDEEHIIVLTSQMHQAIAAPFTYNSNTNLVGKPLIFSYDMTSEATSAKLMWALGQTKVAKEVQALMYKNLAGEITDDLGAIPVVKRY